MLTVSNYHYIRDDFKTKYPSIFGIYPDDFRNQLQILKNNSEFVKPSDLIANGDEILEAKDNFSLITFDDGLKEQFTKALPILEELQLPAVFFVNSRNLEDKKVSTVHKIHLLRSILATDDFLKILKSHSIQLNKEDDVIAQNIYIYDTSENASLKYLLNFKLDFSVQEEIIKVIFDSYFEEHNVLEELYLNENEIIEISKKGFLGSHTHNHYPIGLLTENAIEFELKNSKTYLENLTNSAIEIVSYPYGTQDACTNQVAQIAMNVGYKYGFTTTRGINTIQNNKLLLNRFDCNDLPGGKNYKEI